MDVPVFNVFRGDLKILSRKLEL